MKNLNNSLNHDVLTSLDMIKSLLEKPYKLVLVQQHELERLRTKEHRSQHFGYIESLYKHYIIKKLPKTYNR